MRCTCGRYMHLEKEHLNYVLWTCSCGRREVRWKGTDPEVLHREVKTYMLKEEEFQCYLNKVIGEVCGEHGFQVN